MSGETSGVGVGVGKMPTAKVRGRKAVPDWVLRTALIAAAIVVWDLIGRSGWTNRLFISSPAGVAKAIVDIAAEPLVRRAFEVTLPAILWAFVIASVLGTAIGVVLGMNRFLRAVYFDWVVVFMGLPKAIFVPIFLLIFGREETAVAFGVFSAIFYVIINVVGGVDLIVERHLTMAHAFGATRFQTLRTIHFRSALPGIVAALWYSLQNAFVGVLIVELFVSNDGLGTVIRMYSSQLRSDRVYALVITVSVIAIVLGVLWTRIETRLTRWQRRGAGNRTF